MAQRKSAARIRREDAAAKQGRVAPDYANSAISKAGTRTRKPAKPDEPEKGTAWYCLQTMEAYEAQFGTEYSKRGKNIINRYRDKRTGVNEVPINSDRSFNILWSNVQVLKPTLYARTPKAEVVRRFKDQDPVGRCAAEIAERATDVEIEYAGLNATLEKCVLDRLLPGRGQLWVTYAGKVARAGDQAEKTLDGMSIDYVGWDDFGHSAVPDWAQVTKVWRWKYFTRDAVKETFKNYEKFIDKLEFNARPDTKDDAEKQTPPEARIAELWDRSDKKVKWVSKAVPDYLDEYDFPIDLQKSFPCPPPLYATLTNDSLVPTADFYLYQDQANEVDKLTGRINRLTDALRIVGVVADDMDELKQLLDPSGVPDNTLVPVSMSDLTGKGGLINMIQTVPIDQVVAALQAAYIAREQAIAAIYQITGISDIIRGQSDPNETARAQDIKAQFGGTRIRSMQQDVARFSRDTIRIMTEFIVELYDPMKLWEMTNAESYVGTVTVPPDPMAMQMAQATGQPPPQPQQKPNTDLFAAAIKLLKQDKLRSYRVDIETDSTIALDEADAKQSATEFVTAIGGLLQQAVPAIQQAPALAPFIKELIMYMSRMFKAGRGLEMSLEQSMDALAKQPPQMSPEQIKKAMADLEKGKQEIAKGAEKNKADEMRNTQDKMQNKMDADVNRIEKDAAKGQINLEAKEAVLEIKSAALQAKSGADGATMKLQSAANDTRAATAEHLAAQKPDKEREKNEKDKGDRDDKVATAILEGQSQLGQLIVNQGKMISDGLKELAKPKSIKVDRSNGQVTGAHQVN